MRIQQLWEGEKIGMTSKALSIVFFHLVFKLADIETTFFLSTHNHV